MSQIPPAPVYSCRQCNKICSTQNSLFTHTLQCCPEFAATLSRREKRVQTVSEIERAVAERREAALPAQQEKKENEKKKKLEKKNTEDHEIVARGDSFVPVGVNDAAAKAIVFCSHCREEIKKGDEDDTAVLCDAAPNSCFLHLRCVALLNKHAHALFSSKRNEKEVLEMPFYCARHQKELESNAISKLIFEKAKKKFEEKYARADGTISAPISAAQRDSSIFADLSDDSEVTELDGSFNNEIVNNPEDVNAVAQTQVTEVSDTAASASAGTVSNPPETVNAFKALFSNNSDLKRMQAHRNDPNSNAALASAAASAAVGKHELSRKRRLSSSATASSESKKKKDDISLYLRPDVKAAKEAVAKYGAQFYEAKIVRQNGTRGAAIRCKFCNVYAGKKTSLKVHDDTDTHKAKVASFKLKANDVAGLVQPQLHLSVSTIELRERIVLALLKNGISLSTIEDDLFRSVLQAPSEGGGELPRSRRTYAELIPSILAKERAKMKHLYKRKKNVFVVYDGTTRIAQVMGIILFYFDEGFNMHKEVVRVDHRYYKSEI